MDALDKLKQDWQKNGQSFPAYSEKDIYGMLHRRSSSIVKWILIISILEFAFWLAISFAMKDSQSQKKMESFHVDYVTLPMTIVGYIIMIYFFVKFYINYKKISTTDSVKVLMANILNTRKTVKYYIIANISYLIVTCIIIFSIYFQNDADLLATLHRSEANGEATKFYLIYIAMTVLSILVLVGLFWLFYKLIYGILLKRLRRNYDELKKIDF